MGTRTETAKNTDSAEDVAKEAAKEGAKKVLEKAFKRDQRSKSGVRGKQAEELRPPSDAGGLSYHDEPSRLPNIRGLKLDVPKDQQLLSEIDKGLGQLVGTHISALEKTLRTGKDTPKQIPGTAELKKAIDGFISEYASTMSVIPTPAPHDGFNMPNGFPRSTPQQAIPEGLENSLLMSGLRKDIDTIDANLTGKALGEDIKSSEILKSLANLRDKANTIRILIPDDIADVSKLLRGLPEQRSPRTF